LSRRIVGFLLIFGGAMLWEANGLPAESVPLPYPQTQPTARVVIVRDPTATHAFKPRPEIVRGMVNRAVTRLAGTNSEREAWRGLVSSQDVVGIKVFSSPGANSGTRACVVAPIIEGLLAAGIPSDHIIIWDRQLTDLRLAGFSDLARQYKVRLAGADQEGFDEHVFYDTALLGNLMWGDSEFGKKGAGIGRKSFVTRLLTRKVTKIINVTPLLNHNFAGVCGNLYGLAIGSVDNTVRFESDSDRLARAVPETYALTNLSERVVLNVVDALICQYEGGERGLLHYSTALNEIRVSRDPVALDMLSLTELDAQRKAADAPEVKPNYELYQNASLLELGVSDLKQIQLDIVTNAPATNHVSEGLNPATSFGIESGRKRP
jgi:hypothetical protein